MFGTSATSLKPSYVRDPAPVFGRNRGNHRLLSTIDARWPKPRLPSATPTPHGTPGTQSFSSTGPRRHCAWPPTGCTAPTAPWAPSCAGRKRTWERPRPSPPQRISWPGSSIPCCVTARSTRTLAPNTTRVSISSERCVRPSGGAAQLGYQLVPISDAPEEHTTPASPGVPIAA